MKLKDKLRKIRTIRNLSQKDLEIKTGILQITKRLQWMIGDIAGKNVKHW